MIYLGLGSNIEPRRQHLRKAKELLQRAGLMVLATSPIYETPALLPLHATNDWQKNFLNQVIAIQTNASPFEILHLVKEVELHLGRDGNTKWGPRPIDIDILLYHDQKIQTTHLTIPHAGLTEREFFLRPLLDVALQCKDTDTYKEYKKYYDAHTKKLPKWMYIANITPDSFSSQNVTLSTDEHMQTIKEALESGAHIIDIGAESTRPDAKPISAKEEWARIEPILHLTLQLAKDYEAEVSVDTYHAETMKKSIALGVDYINDVSGLSTPEVRDVFSQSSVKWIAMHNLGLPASRERILPKQQEAYLQILDWIKRLEVSTSDQQRLWLDPGIGFGKDAAQSRNLLQHTNDLMQMGYPILLGHSRKSFLTGITNREFKDRDIETIAISIKQASLGVDILRIHNIKDHQRAYLSYLA